MIDWVGRLPRQDDVSLDLLLLLMLLLHQSIFSFANLFDLFFHMPARSEPERRKERWQMQVVVVLDAKLLRDHPQ